MIQHCRTRWPKTSENKSFQPITNKLVAAYPTSTSTAMQWSTPLRYCPSSTNSWRTRGAQTVPSTMPLKVVIAGTMTKRQQPLEPSRKADFIRPGHAQTCQFVVTLLNTFSFISYQTNQPTMYPITTHSKTYIA